MRHVPERATDRALPRPSPIVRCRQGIATLWVILFLPLALLLLCLVVEIGNLWLARAELENALESAALASAKQWGDDNGSFGTNGPRLVGRAYGQSNSVRGNAVTIDLNYNANSSPNENAATSGATADLVFGSITDFNPNVVFNADLAPACELPVTIVTFTDDTFLDPNAIIVSFPLSAPSNFHIASVTLRIPNSDPGIPGVFDPVGPGSFGPTTGTLNGISAGNVQFSFTNIRTMTATFLNSDFERGDTARFGIDTDFLALKGAGFNNGADFGRSPVGVRVVFSDGTQAIPATGTLQPFSIFGFSLSFLSMTVRGLDPAVHVQASVEVPSVCGNLLGLGPFTVSANSTARYNCNTNEATLIRVDQFVPPMP